MLGGTIPLDNADPESSWTVDQDVEDFVVDGYLRGWGLTGQNVSLDVGVALFPRRADVDRWTIDAVLQIERKFGESCEGVDVHSCDPRNSTHKKIATNEASLESKPQRD